MKMTASNFECSICLDFFDQDSLPRMLKACGHTFCEHCLFQLQEKASPATGVICPSCRTETKLTKEDTFPINYPLLEMIEQAQKQESAMKRMRSQCLCLCAGLCPMG